MTTEQLRAATSNSQLCYVKAGPGSGKTFLAAEAFGYLRFVRHRKAAGGVVGVTFARSARRELENRIRVRWGARSIDWPNSVCTFDELHRRLIRYLIFHDLIRWPSEALPDPPHDSWWMHPDSTPRPGQNKRCFLTLDDEGRVTVRRTDSKIRAPNPAFIDKDKFLVALSEGHCTHNDVRNVLTAAIDNSLYPLFADAIQTCLAGSICHLIIDEAFDMNELDIAVVSIAIEAGVPVTIVGDPWQSLYEFRGSSPRDVKKLLKRHNFRRVDMPGKHRYKTSEMLELSGSLFRGDHFQVRAPVNGDEFDVVLAQDWSTLWTEDQINVLPAGIPSKIDRGPMACAFVLLVNEVVQSQFGIETAGIGEATRAIDIADPEHRLEEPLELLREKGATENDIWRALRRAFQPSDISSWPDPKKMAKKYLKRLMTIVRAKDTPALGLSVHQAKGLEWDRVLLLDGELSTSPGKANVLNVDEGSHRNVYVGLTRARSKIRVLHVNQNRYAPLRSAIKHVTVSAESPKSG